MFSSTRISDSSYKLNNSTINESTRSPHKIFTQPKITSTPLRRESIFATPPKPHILSPRRYSLSEIATPPRTQHKRDLSNSNSHQNPPGPLLASTKFNVNVSTYEDTKTPGLAGRIVQYNEEAERDRESRRPTHQTKYGTVGLFPIVHLFKKKTPHLQGKPRHVTVRISSPDYSRHHTQEYNRKLLEEIVKPGGGGFGLSQSKAETKSTRSVLDALKEISRKRMHVNEGLELYEDSGKRIRTDNGESSEGNKRQRDDSPLLETTSPTRPLSKKICMYDEYAASCSSMDFSFKKSEPLVPKRKSVNMSTLTENPKESKQVKLINAETQTANEEADKATNDTSKEENEPQADQDKTTNTRESVLRVFDDAPLERIRKNRLAALLGSLAGKEASLVQKPDISTTMNGDANESEVSTTKSSLLNTSEKPLVSILSTPNKSPHKSDKHVHFSVPESTSQVTITSSIPATITSNSTVLVSSNISSQSNSVVDISPRLSVPPSSPVSSGTTSLVPPTGISTPSFSFGSTTDKVPSVTSLEKSQSTLFSLSKDSSIALPTSLQATLDKPSVPSFGSIVGNSNASPGSSQLKLPPSSTSSPPKMGGFKFDLSKPPVASTSNNTQSIASFSSSQTFKSDSPLVGKSPVLSFGSKTSVPSSSNNFMTGGTIATTTTVATISTPLISTSSMPSFNFGPAKTQSDSTASKTPIFNATTTSLLGSTTTSVGESSKSPAFSFATKDSQVSKSQATPFTFGSPKPSVSATTTTTTTTFATPSGFGSSAGFTAVAPTSSVASTFSPQTTSISSFIPSQGAGFGSDKPTNTFGTTTSAPTFGTTSTSTSSPFGNNSAFGQSSSQPSFGAPTTTSLFSSNTFGSPKAVTTTSGSFLLAGSNNPPITSPQIFGGTTVTQASGFGAAQTNIPFGNTTTSPFGNAVSTSTPALGNTTTFTFGAKTSTSNTFGGFGTPTSATGFGAKTEQNTGFGQTTDTVSGFGTTTSASNVFGATTSINTGFGSTTNVAAAFGATNNTSTVTPNSFGNTPSFGQNNIFGGSSNTGNNASMGAVTTTQPGGFATKNTPSFGTTTSTQPTNFGAASTTQSSGFGMTNTPSFGGFGAANKDSIFGNASTATFGASLTAPTFGASQPAGFGSTNNASGFGGNSSAFGKPQPASNMFGNTQSTSTSSNAFGSGNAFATNQQQGTPSFGVSNTPSTQAPVFSFGSASTASKPSGVFSFGGASGDKPKFNFSSGTSAPPAFGSNSTPFGGTGSSSFGGTSSPAFGAAAPPAFGASQPTVPGTFSIGSGPPTSGRPRTQIKAKRRT